MTGAPDAVTTVDPFDLPDWLGAGEVTWSSQRGVRGSHLVEGELTGGDPASGSAGDQVGALPCDLLAVDEAHPSPVAADDVRTSAHLAWRHGQILLVEIDGRLTLAVPGTRFTADLVLEALTRLAKAVGALPDDYAARLRIGADRAR